MAFAYGALGDKEQERAYSDRMNGVMRAILASGDGLSQSSPRHILLFDHALDVLAAEGFSCGKSRIVSRSVEFVPLAVSYVVEGKNAKDSILISVGFTGTSPKVTPIKETVHGNSTTSNPAYTNDVTPAMWHTARRIRFRRM